MKNTIWTFCFITALLAGLNASAQIIGEETDCSIWESPAWQNPNWSCVKASDWQDTCVPAWLFQDWNCLELDADATLCNHNIKYRMTVYASTSNVSFDCNNQVIDHDWEDGDDKYSGIRLPQQNSVSNISIQNCTIKNVGRYGVNMKRLFRGEQLEGPMIGHRNIRIQNVDIINSNQIGIFVGQNSENVTIDDVYIADSYSGVYLDAGSTYSHIIGSTITGSREREAIAIDSSMYNTIEYCNIENNSTGGIYLYKNCGETTGAVCPIRRKYSASNNTIHNNLFVGNDVQVAWRQYKWYVLGWCAGIDVAGFWRDRSDNNFIYNNYFADDSKLHVKDGPNTIYGNEFDNSDMILGKNAPIGDDPFQLLGTIAENNFIESGVEFDTYDDIFSQLDFFNNVDSQDICMDIEEMNDCHYPTVLWGTNILPAGVVTILFP